MTSFPAAAAFSAGWLVAQLHGPILERPVVSESPLPTVNELGRPNRIALTLDQLDAILADPIATVLPAGDESVTATALRAAWNPAKPGETEALRIAAETLHIQLLMCLEVGDAAAGAAYMLGRSLSDTCWLPRDRDSFDREFEKFRIANLQRWLSQIEADLPTHAAQAVSEGLDRWVAWLTIHTEAATWSEHQSVIERAVRAQGERWRALLSGDVDAVAGLTPEAWVWAAEAALHRASRLVRRTAAHFWGALLGLGLATAATLAVIFVFTAGAAKAWGTALSLAASVGITGTSLKAAAKRLAVGATTPFLNAVETDAIVWATTCLPPVVDDSKKRRRLNKLGVAPPASGLEKDEGGAGTRLGP
jgi:hypothetical protein